MAVCQVSTNLDRYQQRMFGGFDILVAADKQLYSIATPPMSIIIHDFQTTSKVKITKVPNPRKLKCGTWFIQLLLNGESIPVGATTKKECINQTQLIKAEYKAGKREAKRKEPEPPKSPPLSEAIDALHREAGRRAVPCCGGSVIRQLNQEERSGKMKKKAGRAQPCGPPPIPPSFARDAKGLSI